jgi:hypothetical protein
MQEGLCIEVSHPASAAVYKNFAMTKLLERITLSTSDDPVENWRYKDGKYKTQSVRENTHANPHNNRDKYCEPKSCNFILLISFFIFLLSQSLSFFFAKAKFIYRPLCRIEQIFCNLSGQLT